MMLPSGFGASFSQIVLLYSSHVKPYLTYLTIRNAYPGTFHVLKNIIHDTYMDWATLQKRYTQSSAYMVQGKELYSAVIKELRRWDEQIQKIEPSFTLRPKPPGFPLQYFFSTLTFLGWDRWVASDYNITIYLDFENLSVH